MGCERQQCLFIQTYLYVDFLAPSAVDDEDDAAETPSVFTLFQNRPNPFNPSTAIPFALGEDGRVSLTIYDLLGREVTVLADGHMSAGGARTDMGRSHEGRCAVRVRRIPLSPCFTARQRKQAHDIGEVGA